ncbi:hypothetical protein B0H16DRAFT_1454326 [Mycena metata]|uniref:Uncharacterized protein n=1 Tax=Mycena metata TaxID=1033252 RepID=A0AAD7JIV4_9AGAR|nr:hypothetical protein B0H16DRAFT_1454326 [Mycena metata]
MPLDGDEMGNKYPWSTQHCIQTTGNLRAEESRGTVMTSFWCINQSTMLMGDFCAASDGGNERTVSGVDLSQLCRIQDQITGGPMRRQKILAPNRMAAEQLVMSGEPRPCQDRRHAGGGRKRSKFSQHRRAEAVHVVQPGGVKNPASEYLECPEGRYGSYSRFLRARETDTGGARKSVRKSAVYAPWTIGAAGRHGEQDLFPRDNWEIRAATSFRMVASTSSGRMAMAGREILVRCRSRTACP